jgi:GT2 family glycosyltransferase
VTYERPAFLERCLRALEAHLTPDAQIVVVDASAADATTLVSAIRPTAVYVHAPHLAGWMTRSRNEALLHATGAIISFLDDDVVVSPGWQDAVLTAFEDATVDAVAGRTRNLQPGEERYDPPIGRLLEDGSLTEGFASLPPEQVDVDHGIGANMSFRRSTLARLGGFRDDYPGTAMREDTDIYLRVQRLGGRAVFSPAAVVDHLPAPHVKGARFDTRYKLYARRNHMVLLARHDGIRSVRLRRWIAREYRGVADAGSWARRAQRWGVTTLGISWGAVAMLRQARWSASAPERGDAAGRRLRAALSAPARGGVPDSTA